MKCNVGKTEQIIRILLGITIVSLGVYYKNWWGVIGLAPIITGIIRYCPLNDILGVSTCKNRKQQNLDPVLGFNRHNSNRHAFFTFFRHVFLPSLPKISFYMSALNNIFLCHIIIILRRYCCKHYIAVTIKQYKSQSKLFPQTFLGFSPWRFQIYLIPQFILFAIHTSDWVSYASSVR